MKIIVYYVVFVIAYITLVTTTAMFFMTWGAKRNVFETAYVFFLANLLIGVFQYGSYLLMQFFGQQLFI